MDFYIKPESSVRDLYIGHGFYNEGDSGMDIFFATTEVIPAKSTVLIDFQITCELKSHTPSKNPNRSYWLLPRSSIYKTPLRLANSVGLIDSKYRGHIKAAVDNTSNKSYKINRGERLFQLASATLEPFNVVVTINSLSSSDRGSGGFGSTGK
jgi:dUTP pyrophosphatase